MVRSMSLEGWLVRMLDHQLVSVVLGRKVILLVTRSVTVSLLLTVGSRPWTV